MDIEHFISTPDQILFGEAESHMQELPYDLYDQQSEQEPNFAYHSIDEVLNDLMQNQDIIDKPVSEIVSQALLQYNIPEKKLPQLVRKLKKTKNILKRNRAKNRVTVITEKMSPPEKRQYLFEESSTEKDTITIQKQIKKQRNRISAQISRDRKKNYVANLENRNKQLAIQSQQLKLENQKLRKQISEKSNLKKQAKTNSGNSFVRLLILLGVVFLTYILKDVLNFKANQSKNISEINENSEDDDELSILVNLTEKDDIVQQIKNQIVQIDHDKKGIFNGQPAYQKQSVHGFKEIIIKKVVQMTKKTKQFLQPKRFKAHMKMMKNLLSL